MKWYRLSFMRFKVAMRDIYSLVFLFVALLVAIISMAFEGIKQQDRLTIAVVNEDMGSYGERLLASLEKDDLFTMLRLPREKALLLLRQGRLEAVMILCKDYTQILESGDFHNTIELYYSHSSRASATVSEPFLNKTLLYWVEERAVMISREYLQELGSSFSESDETLLRTKIVKLLDDKSLINLDTVYLDTVSNVENIKSSQILGAGLGWYATFCMFYMLVSSAWILDLNNATLCTRIKQTGARLWQIVLGAALVPMLLCLFGYLFIIAISCFLFSVSFLDALNMLPHLAIYLFGTLGLIMLITSSIKHIMSLLFLAPIATALCAAFSGLLIELPKWADFLVTISRVLPGRWFNYAINGNADALAGGLLCAAGWIFSGIIISVLLLNKEPKTY